MLMLMSILMFFGEVFRIVKAMLLGFPPEFRVTVYVRKFFPFPLWKRFRKTGIPEYRSGNFPEISGFRNNWYHNYIKVLHM